MSSIPPFNPAKVAALTINGLGDSIIGGQSIYALLNSPTYQSQLANSVAAWTPSTAYGVNTVVKNGGYAYYCTTAGTSASSSGPSGTGSSIADGTCVWHYNPALRAQKNGTSMLFWAEAFSLGHLRWDLSQGYGGIALSLLKIIVINGGSGYASGDTITLSPGGKATLSIAGGMITGVTITNCGYSSTNTFAYTINTSTGSGAVLSLVGAGTGTFGVPGCWTQDMVARLPDCLASSVDIFLVNGGTNDVVYGVAVATVCANLRTCYETLMAAGRKVIATPITPRATNNLTTIMTPLQRVNHWIRAYCRGEPWANPNGFNQIALADPTGYWTDGTNSQFFYPIGGTGGVQGAVTQDGLHPSHRGAIYWGYVVWQAAQKFTFASPAYSSRGYSVDDGYDSVLAPGGNFLEGVGWLPLNGYVVGQQCYNGTSIYRCVTAGTSGTSGSGGPLGSGSNISDGTCAWTWMKAARTSVMGCSSTSAAATVGSVTVSGNLPSGFNLSRYGGSAAGTVVCAIESPWSNGQKGQRISMTYTLGSGTTVEQWALTLGFADTVTSMNIQSNELGVNYFEFEAELEIGGMTNMTQFYLFSASGDTNVFVYAGANSGGVGYEFPATSGDPMSWPNGGKVLLRSAPVLLPANLVNFYTQLILGFNASGAAGSATATIKLNYLGARRYAKQ